ncbi:MAG TPA: dienelactone hydrolase family protein [Gaiellaceae bacterium]|jgi:carboxymethylenebutenolidase|nr:dienelactone hydrolase family protein [Gaiellaceae bacterium]
MCFDTDSTPPIPAISGAAVSHDRLTLTATDGNEFAAFRAMPDGPATTGVVILPDVRGLYRFYEELALRFAERGHVAVAFDYFGRSAGVGERDDDFDYKPHVDQTTPQGVQTDVGACVEHVRELGCASTFTVGFCFGGSGSWASAAGGHGLQGAVGFYGRPSRMLDRVPHIEAPILALQAGADQAISHEDNLELEQALREHGKEYELIEYEGAPHSFFDRKQKEFADASEDAWRRVLEFIGRYERPPGRT